MRGQKEFGSPVAEAGDARHMYLSICPTEQARRVTGKGQACEAVKEIFYFFLLIVTLFSVL